VEIARASAMKIRQFPSLPQNQHGLAWQLHLSEIATAIGGFSMSAVGDEEFLRLLKGDVDYFTRAIERFEDLIPNVCAPLQDQWRLQAQSRRNFALELEILLDKAEDCVSATPGQR
jgi:hypothetical protein